jgi:DNA-binding Lrp family transcriptional regulator
MVDKKDLLILDALKKNAKAPITQISKNTGLPGTTVHNRINRLRKDGIIKEYTIKVDNKKIGRGISAYVSVVLSYDSLRKSGITEEAQTLKMGKMPCVEEANTVTGDYDIMLKVRSSNIDELNEFVTKTLRSFQGVQKTKTIVILKELLD